MSDDDPVFAGVRLEQHAGVAAALTEEIPLDEVLAQEGIERSKWDEANRHFRVALAESPDLMAKYLQKKRQAEDCLRRKIEPLDDDAASFQGFLAAVNTADDPRTVVAGLGLRMTDLGRLGRAWKKRAKDDPSVVDALRAAAGKSESPRSVRVEPVKLKRFPWSPGAAEASARASERPQPSPATELDLAALRTPRNGVLPIEDDVDLYAALSVVLQLVPGDKRTILPLCGIDERRLDALNVQWRARLGADPDLNATFAVRSGDHRAAFRRLLAGGRGFIEG